MKQLGKKVQYYGMDITITQPFVAVDTYGSICTFQQKPHIIYGRWAGGVRGNYSEVGYCDLEGMDWKETLVDYSHLFEE